MSAFNLITNTCIRIFISKKWLAVVRRITFRNCGSLPLFAPIDPHVSQLSFFCVNLDNSCFQNGVKGKTTVLQRIPITPKYFK